MKILGYNLPMPDTTPTQILDSPAVEFAVREQEAATSLIVDLIGRMEKAEKTITDMAALETDTEECERLTAKANGVNLCLSYAREALGMTL